MTPINVEEIVAPKAGSRNRQEALFAAFAVAAALLARGGGDFAYPGILWVAAGLLAVNGAVLRIFARKPGVACLLSIGLNTLLVTYLLDGSGGPDSQMWPLYLFPIFSAAMTLPEWTLRAAGLSIAQLLCLYLESLQAGDAGAAADLAFKAAFLLVAAAAVERLGRRENTRLKSRSGRQEALDDALRLREARRLEAAGRGALEAALGEMGGRLSLILASAQLLLDEAPADGAQKRDAERILLAAQDCAELTRRLILETDALRRRGAPAPGGRP